MKFKKFARLICVAALAGAAVAVPLMSGCNTDHPEARITIEYDSVTYVLNYKMYRNMYPQTVKHFIELADNGFYNNTIIHNYQSNSSNWYGGGYRYEESSVEGELSYSRAYDEGESGLLTYMQGASKEAEYAELADPAKGKITPSVYRDFINGEYTSPLNTLIGEFSNNQHKIEKGALKGSFGALRTFYSDKSDYKNHVYLNKQGSPAGVQGEYRYNSTTSLFSIQTSTSTSSDSNYCIFGVLKNTDVLTDLKQKVNGVATDEVHLYVDNKDAFVEPNVNSTAYRVTKTPIIIREVKITKY